MKILGFLMLFLSIFVALFVLSINLNYSAILNTFYERNSESVITNRKRSLKIIEHSERLIAKSNVRFFIPFYGIKLHLLGSAFFTFLFFSSNFFTHQLSINIIFGLIGATIPTVILNIIGFTMESRVKKQSINFLNGIKNNYITTGDIFVAIESVIYTLREPLKSYTLTMIAKRKAKLSPYRILDEFKKNVGELSELGLFVDNLKLAITEGADIQLLIEKYIIDIEKLNEIDDEFLAEEMSSSLMSYIFIFIVVSGVKMIYSADFATEIVKSLWHQGAVAIALIICFYMIINSLRR